MLRLCSAQAPAGMTKWQRSCDYKKSPGLMPGALVETLKVISHQRSCFRTSYRHFPV